MEPIQGYHTGDIDLSEPLSVLGTVKGTISVRSRGNLTVNGTVEGNVIAYAGSIVLINGYVKGRLENVDGQVTLNGTVEELQDHPEARPTFVDPKAYVRKRI